MMYLHGRNVLREILKLEPKKLKIKKVLFTDQKNVDRELEELKEHTAKKGYRMEVVPPEKLFNLSREKKHQGVVINLKEFPYTSLETLLDKIMEKKRSLLVLLDRIQDPHNLGAIIRSSVAAGADGVIITEKASVEVTPAVVKVSTGLVFRIPIVRVVNMARTIETLKEEGFWTYAATMEGEPYYSVSFTDKAALIFGNEGKGIRHLVKKKSDYLVSIPMCEGIDSLNVAASAAIMLFEYRRQWALREGVNP
ncbi:MULTISPECIES: 23S rRNA (guanosine(2251)-2'-O)-methyltransferase RlmB [Kosmotoga]|nr:MULTISPECIES: 23S rRNA (guanosine(2251)-2'-O)-methyltransferase RlmB [Kosmotoga]